MITSGTRWYCVHTKPKCERSAALVLSELPGIATFCPQIRFQRSTRRGKVWFVEGLFPSYFFAQFDASTMLRAVRYSQNIIRVVEFGGLPVAIPEETIALLKREMNHVELREIKIDIKIGDSVVVTEGPMRGLVGIVESLRSGEERVRVLLEFLGRQNVVEVSVSKLITDAPPRAVVAPPGKPNE